MIENENVQSLNNLGIKGDETVSDSKLKNLDNDELKTLAESTKNPETLDKLANLEDSGNIDEKIKIAVAQNENTSSETLDKLSSNEDSYVKHLVAENANTTPETLDKLSNDEFSSVRLSVALNENTSEATLDKLSNDSSERVKEAVAGNENTSEATLDKLSNDKSEIVVEAVAGNQTTSFETLEKLGENDNSKISETAKETIENKADDQLKDIDKDKEAKTLADGIDVLKDGKFDNDSGKDKQANHDSEGSRMKA